MKSLFFTSAALAVVAIARAEPSPLDVNLPLGVANVSAGVVRLSDRELVHLNRNRSVLLAPLRSLLT
jgi:hypothetical protein